MVSYDKKYNILYMRRPNNRPSYGEELSDGTVVFRDVKYNNVTGFTIHMNNSDSIEDAIDKILNSPKRIYTKDEAKMILQEIGILNESGEVTEQYKNIIKKNNKRDG